MRARDMINDMWQVLMTYVSKVTTSAQPPQPPTGFSAPESTDISSSRHYPTAPTDHQLAAAEKDQDKTPNRIDIVRW